MVIKNITSKLKERLKSYCKAIGADYDELQPYYSKIIDKNGNNF